jgi:hypothetical protein
MKRFIALGAFVLVLASLAFGQITEPPAGGGGGTGTVTNVGFTLNSGSTCGALTVSGAPVTTSGTLNIALTGVTGHIVTFSSNCFVDSNTLLSSLETNAAAIAAFSGIGSCTNQVVTVANANAAPTCATITSAYVNSSIAPTASPTFTGTPAAPTATALTSNTQLATTAYADAAVLVEKGRAQTAEALAAPLASPTFTGVPAGPTAAIDAGSTQLATTAYVDRMKTRSISFQFGSPGGSAISTGILGYITVPFACSITGWSIAVDAGTATVKTLKVAAGTAIPTLGSNSISTSGVAIASGTVLQSTTLTDFTTTTVTANDIIAADLITTSGVGYIDFQLVCAQ